MRRRASEGIRNMRYLPAQFATNRVAELAGRTPSGVGGRAELPVMEQPPSCGETDPRVLPDQARWEHFGPIRVLVLDDSRAVATKQPLDRRPILGSGVHP
jgi:hypothetical protein